MYLDVGRSTQTSIRTWASRGQEHSNGGECYICLQRFQCASLTAIITNAGFSAPRSCWAGARVEGALSLSPPSCQSVVVRREAVVRHIRNHAVNGRVRLASRGTRSRLHGRAPRDEDSTFNMAIEFTKNIAKTVVSSTFNVYQYTSCARYARSSLTISYHFMKLRLKKCLLSSYCSLCNTICA